MVGFEWAENNLGAETPHRLQEDGVNVYFAPMIARGEKVVDLANGRVTRFAEDERRPQEGYFAEYDSLARYCRAREIPLSETDGQASTQPVSFEEAGDPLTHGGL